MTPRLTRINRRKASRSNRLAARLLLIERLEQRQCLSADVGPLFDFSQLEVDPASYDGSSLIVRYRIEAAQPAGEAYGPVRTAGVESLGFDMQKVVLKPGVSWQSMIDSFERDPDVLYAEPDYQVRIATIPDDPQFADQWDMDNTGQLGGTIDADIDAPDAWDLSTGSGSTVVAVIDTGVDYLHPDLAPNIWSNPGEIAGDGIDNDDNGFVDDVHGYDFFNDDGDPLDDHNHGTHVAGTIGAEGNNAIGIAFERVDHRLPGNARFQGDLLHVETE
jgi:subtilisin family serine protease